MRFDTSLKVTSYRRDGEDEDRAGVVLPARRPTRRASAPLSRYDRLAPDDQPETARVRLDGMERLRAALDGLATKMGLSEEEAMLSMVEQMRKAGWRV